MSYRIFRHAYALGMRFQKSRGMEWHNDSF
jgi:hypothetical protein